jgi:serine/threonine protein phosphatase 1
LHSFFSPFKKALEAKVFEPNNPEHLLVVLGDCFDRGSESVEMLEFLDSLSNVVLIRGNHEDLLVEMLDRGYGERHDMSNGTVQTVVDLCDSICRKTASTKECCDAVKELITPFLNKMVNYFETKNYIFVHGWIPCDVGKNSKPWYQNGRKLKYNPDWRNSDAADWEASRWINGPSAGYASKILEPGKTIVCGHWHCSYGHYMRALKKALAEDTNLEVEEFGPTAIWEPFADEGILAIDRCTAHTREVNVVILEDELLEEI